MMPGSPPKCCFQKALLSTRTFGPPCLSSSDVKNLPRAGLAPSTEKSAADVTRACADTGSVPGDAMETRRSMNAVNPSNDFARLRQMTKFATLNDPTPQAFGLGFTVFI